MSLPLDTMTLNKAPVCMWLRQLDACAPPTRRQMTHQKPTQGLVGGTAYSSTTTNIAMSVPDSLLPSGDHDTGVTDERDGFEGEGSQQLSSRAVCGALRSFPWIYGTA